MTVTITEHIRRHLLDSFGISTPVRRMPSLDVLRTEQWSMEFETLRRNRMIMGAFRYGLLAEQNGRPPYDNIGSLIERARAYQESGNLEHLTDIANLAMVEFAVGRHPKRHFRAMDDNYHASLTPNP